MPPKGKRASTGSLPASKRKRDNDEEESHALGEISGNSLSAGRAKETSLFRKLSDARTSTDSAGGAKKARTSALSETVSDARRDQEYQEIPAARDAMKDKIWAESQKQCAAMEAEDSSGSSLSAESVKSEDEARDARAGLKRLKRMMRKGAFMDSSILERIDAVRADITDAVGEEDMDVRFKKLNKRVEKLEAQMRTADKDRTTIFEVLNDRLKGIEATLEERFDRQDVALDALMKANLSHEELLATGQYED